MALPRWLGLDTPERVFAPPVAWLFGQQLIGSLKGILLYVAYGKKLDPRDWMQASVFPSSERVQALRGWRGEMADPDPQTQQDDEAYWHNRGEFWFDYIADTGDGARATYSVAYLCSSDLFAPAAAANKLPGDPSVALHGADEGHDFKLPRGHFLFIGGDTSYHLSDYMTLANRLQRPFQWAYEDALADTDRRDGDLSNRPLFGIPGNHDYYDQLDGFRRQFRRPVRPEPSHGRINVQDEASVLVEVPQLFIPGYSRRQLASYVALQLPFGWWFWGLDTEVGQIDERQQRFFRGLCTPDASDPRRVRPPDKLILATCAPTTVFGEFATINDEKAYDAIKQLGLSTPFRPMRQTGSVTPPGDAQMKSGQCRLDISGDVHHYARYWGPAVSGVSARKHAKAEAPSAGSYASIVSGLGGAFHHPTRTYVDDVQEQVLYPTEAHSTASVADRLLDVATIIRGGNVWLVAAVVASLLAFAAYAPQSTREFINASSLVRRLHLTPSDQHPITPTTLVLPPSDLQSRSVKDTLASEALQPVTSFYSRAHKLLVGSDLIWHPPTPQCDQNPSRYFDGPCGLAMPADLTLGLGLSLLAPVLLLFATFSKKVFKVTAKVTTPGAEVKGPSEHAQTADDAEPARVDSEIQAEPARDLWIVTLASTVCMFVGLATIRPYRGHVTPFGNSALTLWSLIWAVAAVALAARYSEYLFKRSHVAYIRRRDWILTGWLCVAALAEATLGLWWFGKQNLPALLLTDIVFMVVGVGTSVALVALPFAAGGELLQPRPRWIRYSGAFLIGAWHAVLQMTVPFVVIRKGSVITVGVLLLLIYAFSQIGTALMRRGMSRGLVCAWVTYGLALLWLPYLTAESFGLHPLFPGDIRGWFALVPSVAAGTVGGIVGCSVFGWYLAVCFMLNGHNNEVGGAARIEDFKGFVRVKVTPDSLTAYVIAVDRPQDDRNRHELHPKLVDVVRLTVKS